MDKNIKDKAFYTMNFNNASINLAIQNSREKIAEINVLKEKLSPEYEKTKSFYEEAKELFLAIDKQWNSLQESIDQQNILINGFTTFNKSTAANKILKRSIDVKDVPDGTKKDMNVKWLPAAVNVLNKEDKFMTWEEIWYEFAKDAELVAKCNKNITKFKDMKGVAGNGIMKHILRTNRKHGEKLLCVYHDKIGIADWVDENNVPYNPKHMKEFAYHQGGQQNMKAI